MNKHIKHRFRQGTQSLAYWSPAGLETAGFAFFALLSLYAYVRRSRILVLSIAIATLLRPEGVVIAVTLILISLTLDRPAIRFTVGSALGAAILGALAAGSEAGGYDDATEAARHMASVRPDSYKPDPADAEVYDRLYAEYLKLHDYFGRGENDVARLLKRIKLEVGARPSL